MSTISLASDDKATNDPSDETPHWPDGKPIRSQPALYNWMLAPPWTEQHRRMFWVIDSWCRWDPKTETAFIPEDREHPTVDMLAARFGCKRTKAKELMSDLVAFGALLIEHRRKRSGYQAASSYRLAGVTRFPVHADRQRSPLVREVRPLEPLPEVAGPTEVPTTKSLYPEVKDNPNTYISRRENRAELELVASQETPKRNADALRPRETSSSPSEPGGDSPNAVGNGKAAEEDVGGGGKRAEVPVARRSGGERHKPVRDNWPAYRELGQAVNRANRAGAGLEKMTTKVRAGIANVMMATVSTRGPFDVAATKIVDAKRLCEELGFGCGWDEAAMDALKLYREDYWAFTKLWREVVSA